MKQKIFHKSALRLVMIALVGVLPVISGCARKRPSERTPIHVNPDMDRQPKYRTQSESDFFKDASIMRTPVAGTVARGQLRDDDAFYLGEDNQGDFIVKAPVAVNMRLLDRGQERYDIYCSPCHSRVGDGKGIMITRDYVPPPTFHSDGIRNMPDGLLYDVITHGVGNMPSYRHQIPPADRWGIVAYLRALQRSRNATVEDVPVELRETIK